MRRICSARLYSAYSVNRSRSTMVIPVIFRQHSHGTRTDTASNGGMSGRLGVKVKRMVNANVSAATARRSVTFTTSQYQSQGQGNARKRIAQAIKDHHLFYLPARSISAGDRRQHPLRHALIDHIGKLIDLPNNTDTRSCLICEPVRLSATIYVNAVLYRSCLLNANVGFCSVSTCPLCP